MMKNQTVFALGFLLCVNITFAQTQTVGIFLNDSLAFNGYTLFAPTGYNHVYLINNCGYQINQWNCGNHNNWMAYLLDDGSMLRTGVVQSSHFQGGGICGIVDCYSWDGELQWEFEHTSSEYHQHHDIEAMPNGNFLIIAWYKYSEDEALAMGKDPQYLENSLWMDHILEIDPNNNFEIVWEWSSWDHLIQDYDESKENYGVIADHPERIDINYSDQYRRATQADWTHINGIDYNAELDQILVTPRQYSEV